MCWKETSFILPVEFSLPAESDSSGSSLRDCPPPLPRKLFWREENVTPGEGPPRQPQLHQLRFFFCFFFKTSEVPLMPAWKNNETSARGLV